MKYNTTQLNPQQAFERHIYHRDLFAHYLRWSHILKVLKPGQNVCDFGCGTGELAELLYRNRHSPARYIGYDIRSKFNPKLLKLPWVRFIQSDLVSNDFVQHIQQRSDIVVSFEVAEHVGKNNIAIFLKNFKSCGSKNAVYYLSTPNYDPNVGAADNHTYDSGDGRGKVPQEFAHDELESEIIKAGFKITKKYGTFASIKDYEPYLKHTERELFKQLRTYYDTNVLSVIFAPLFPEKSRNCLWVLKNEQ